MLPSRRIVSRDPAPRVVQRSEAPPTTGAPVPAAPVTLKEFIIPNPTWSPARRLAEQKCLFLAFAHDYFGLPESVSLTGLQSAYGHVSGDQFVALEDSRGGSMCLPIALLLEPVDVARKVVADKLKKFHEAFASPKSF